eukprot:COSAG01_NODE_10154_length_2235_cov_4.282776_4_plen_117_part_00
MLEIGRKRQESLTVSLKPGQRMHWAFTLQSGTLNYEAAFHPKSGQKRPVCCASIAACPLTPPRPNAFSPHAFRIPTTCTLSIYPYPPPHACRHAGPSAPSGVLDRARSSPRVRPCR